MKSKSSIIIYAALLLVPIIFFATREDERYVEIDFSNTEEAPVVVDQSRSSGSLNFAIAGVISPRRTFNIYQDMLRYISEKSGRNVILVQRKSYDEINDLFKTGYVKVGIVCSGAYVEGADSSIMEPLVVPEVRGQTVYYSYIIVHKESPFHAFEDLRDRTFAFSDPLSNSGKLSPAHMLARMGETPESFFKEYIYTYSHDNSIHAVASKLVDGAAVDSLILDYLEATNPEITSNLRIIETSPPYGINPVAVSPNLDPALKERLREIFMGMNGDPEGQRILKEIMVDRFVPADDSLYDSIRDMRNFVDKYLAARR